MLYAVVEEVIGLAEADPPEGKFLLSLSVNGVDLLDCMKWGVLLFRMMMSSS